MTARVTNIWRHPIKSHGIEALQSVTLTAGKSLPWDRAWAVPLRKEDIPKAASGWLTCGHFSRGAKNPALVAVTAKLDEAQGIMTLSHPALGDLTFRPDIPDDTQRFLDWIAPLTPPDRNPPAGLVRAGQRAMTDTDYASVSILSQQSLQALGNAAGQALSQLRWRGNIWIDGLPAYDEQNLVGHEIRLGQTRLRVREPIGRCRATSANPETGQIDLDTLDLLRTTLGHTNFGVYAEVVTGGDLALGDTFSVAAEVA